MKIFISALDTGVPLRLIPKLSPMRWNLLSYWYIRKKPELFDLVLQHSEQLMIDSGAHSMQKGAQTDFKAYTLEYAEWIQQNDNDKIIGFFEMDIDNVIGYDNVKSLRKILDKATDKIIPVWHKNRGIKEYINMLEQQRGKIVGITGFKNEDIRDEQYPLFVKEAWKRDCKVHCLGMTRERILDKVPFDFVDSSSWKAPTLYGRYDDVRVRQGLPTEKREELLVKLYNEFADKQLRYYQKWKNAVRNNPA